VAFRVIRLDLEYEGTDFHGFAPQPGLRTVGGELADALGEVLGEPIRLTPGARTDKGVHARGQVVSFVAHSQLAPAAIRSAANALTGRDLFVREAAEKEVSFEARRDARSRRYEYRIWNEPDADLWERRWTAHVAEPLDLEAMDRACAALLGEHDFGAFYTHKAEDDFPRATTRHVLHAGWRRDEARPTLLRFEIEADGFLRHMVRAIVGSAILVGLGKLPLDAIAAMLEKSERAAAGPTAPAAGLTLLEVLY
jgi:tRNA pseudouridine38-40 synthase